MTFTEFYHREGGATHSFPAKPDQHMGDGSPFNTGARFDVAVSKTQQAYGKPRRTIRINGGVVPYEVAMFVFDTLMAEKRP